MSRQLWIRQGLERACRIVYRQEHCCEQEPDAERQSHDKDRLYKRRQSVDRRVNLAIVELCQTVEDVAHFARLLAYLEHLDEYARDLSWAVAHERSRQRLAAFDRLDSLAQNTLINFVLHHVGGNFQSADGGDARGEHNIEVVGYAGEVEFLIQGPDIGNGELKPRPGDLAGGRLHVAVHKEAADDNRDEQKDAVVDEEVADTEYHLSVKRQCLAAVLQNGSDFWNDECHHECHDGYKSHHDERRVDESVFCLAAELVGAVYIVGQV